MKVHIISLGKSATAARGKKKVRHPGTDVMTQLRSSKNCLIFPFQQALATLPRILDDKGRVFIFPFQKIKVMDVYRVSHTNSQLGWKVTWKPLS